MSRIHGTLKNVRHVLYCYFKHLYQASKLVSHVDSFWVNCALLMASQVGFSRCEIGWSQRAQLVCFILYIDLISKCPKLPYTVCEISRSSIMQKPCSLSHSSVVEITVSKIVDWGVQAVTHKIVWGDFPLVPPEHYLHSDIAGLLQAGGMTLLPEVCRLTVEIELLQQWKEFSMPLFIKQDKNVTAIILKISLFSQLHRKWYPIFFFRS